MKDKIEEQIQENKEQAEELIKDYAERGYNALLGAKGKQEDLDRSKVASPENLHQEENPACPPAPTGIQRFYHRYGVDYRTIYALNKKH